MDASKAGSGSKVDIVSMIAAEDIVITAANPIQFSAGSVISDSNITIDVGSMSGIVTISSIDAFGGFSFDAGNASNLVFNAESLSANEATIMLGAVSQDSHANHVSAINITNTFTLNGGSYREGFSLTLFLVEFL